jgi:hypothetical protein
MLPEAERGSRNRKITFFGKKPLIGDDRTERTLLNALLNSDRMKKWIALAAAAIITNGAAAQGLAFGVKCGMNFSRTVGIPEGDIRVLPATHSGVFIEYRTREWFGIQTEVVCSRQGTIYDIPSFRFIIYQDYINVPVLAKYYVQDNLSVDIGPQFGFRVKDGVRETTGSLQVETPVKDLDFSIGMGLSFTVFGYFDLTARYNFGLTDVYTNMAGTNRDKVLQFALGYRF